MAPEIWCRGFPLMPKRSESGSARTGDPGRAHHSPLEMGFGRLVSMEQARLVGQRALATPFFNPKRKTETPPPTLGAW